MRAAIYARYSSDLQRDASIDDQVELCRRYIERCGWTQGRTYSDRAASGGTAFREGFQQLLADLDTGAFDVIVCEALDRIGRKLADVAALHDRLEFHRIELHAANMGRVTAMHVGLLGTMAQLYLSDLKDKTKRGQLGRVLAGRAAGGHAYGYDLIDGQTGARRINPAEAVVVRRIFQDYAAGHSPRAIAKALNAEGVRGPGGREWRDTAIRGQVDRGTGILNNALYAGRIVWNRCSYIKDPRSGKRVARPNPPASWETVAAPDLRIVPDTLWEAAKTRHRSVTFAIGRDDRGNALNRAHRRRFLFSGLLECGVCGGGYTIVGKDRYGCATRRTKGTCGNAATVERHEIEARVLDGLKARLMAPDRVAAFADAFIAETNRLRQDAEQQRDALQSRFDAAERRIAGILRAIEDGHYNRSLTDRLTQHERERDDLRHALDTLAPAPTVRLHPGLAEVYAAKVRGLEDALNDPAIRTEATEAIRSLIARIELRPRTGGGVDALLHGDLARILMLCEEGRNDERPGTGAPGRVISVVAGAGLLQDRTTCHLLRMV